MRAYRKCGALCLLYVHIVRIQDLSMFLEAQKSKIRVWRYCSVVLTCHVSCVLLDRNWTDRNRGST
jgi:hypothetical protein